MEIWQANAAGRYLHAVDTHDAPLDPNFSGAGRALTDDDGWYRFMTIKPGAYPWKNHPNAWRPAHIHFSLFGRAFTERLVTQMYFPGDPLFAYDPIFQSIRDERARERLVSSFDLSLTEPDRALGYRFDIVLGGREETPLEDAEHVALTPGCRRRRRSAPTSRSLSIESRSIRTSSARPTRAQSGSTGLLRDGAGESVPDGMVEIWQANTAGRYAHPADTRDDLPLEDGFLGFGRSSTVCGGRFEFVTVKPGQVPWPEGGLQAPHLVVGVFARGLLKRAVTRMYFPDEASTNALDPVLSRLDPGARATLIAVAQDDGSLRFDIRLQGEGHTTFFAV